jgi:hypothetical protein
VVKVTPSQKRAVKKEMARKPNAASAPNFA